MKLVRPVLLVALITTLSACTLLIKPRVIEPSWMNYDAAQKQVHFELTAAWNANNNGYNYNGYFQDDVIIKVPADWHVSMTLINWDANAPHSVMVTEPYSDYIPDKLTGEFSIFSRAYTDSVFANKRSTMKFIAKAGDYWLFCGDKGHGLNGMWIKLKIDSNIKSPFIEIKKDLTDIRR